MRTCPAGSGEAVVSEPFVSLSRTDGFLSITTVNFRERNKLGEGPTARFLLGADRQGELTRVPRNTAQIIVFVVAVAAIVIVMFATGWADDKAPSGSGGRVPVTHPSGSP